MLNPGNRMTVYYPGRGIKVRNCQSTVYPPGQERSHIIDPIKRAKSFNSWAMYIKDELYYMTTGKIQIDELTRIYALKKVG